jgi:hypothetical protein
MSALARQLADRDDARGDRDGGRHADDGKVGASEMRDAGQLAEQRQVMGASRGRA